MDGIDWIILSAKIVFVLAITINVVPIMVWVERRGGALMQKRLGPNRIGPLGLLQSLVDVVKLLLKEDRAPGHVNKFFYYAAPAAAVVPAFMTFAVIPFGGSFEAFGRTIHLQITDLDVGLLYVLSVASLGVYGIIMGSWASNSKYALLGGVRSTAQMISYELSMGLSLIGVVLVSSSVKLGDIVQTQGQTLMELGPLTVPKWGIFLQPLGFLIFLTAAFAETNRLPFDLPEGESEIVAGYHLEFGSMRFALFFMAEYMNMLTASGMVTSLFLGGWQLFPGMESVLGWVPADWQTFARAALQVSSFYLKVGFLMWFFVWVRWTLPRFRYDQLMDIGWKGMFPLALLNVILTAAAVAAGVL